MKVSTDTEGQEPEEFDHSRLYVPWSKEDAINKLMPLLENAHPNQGKISDWTDKTIDRTLDIILGQGEEWKRDQRNYRDKVSESKY